MLGYMNFYIKEKDRIDTPWWCRWMDSWCDSGELTARAIGIGIGIPLATIAVYALASVLYSYHITEYKQSDIPFVWIPTWFFVKNFLTGAAIIGAAKIHKRLHKGWDSLTDCKLIRVIRAVKTATNDQSDCEKCCKDK